MISQMKAVIWLIDFWEISTDDLYIYIKGKEKEKKLELNFVLLSSCEL